MQAEFTPPEGRLNAPLCKLEARAGMGIDGKRPLDNEAVSLEGGHLSALPEARARLGVKSIPRPKHGGVKRDHGASATTDDLVFIEICAGSAALTAAVRELGVQTLAVDHDHNRFEVKAPVTNMDLGLATSWDALRTVVDEERVICLHASPPSGTCSRARGIPLADGSPGPPPLRSGENSEGLAGLSATDQHKVTAANKLYAGMADFLWELMRLEVPFTVENPANSWLWEMPCMEGLVQACEFVNFHSCAYGSTRKKATSFLTNYAPFQALARSCPGTMSTTTGGRMQPATSIQPRRQSTQRPSATSTPSWSPSSCKPEGSTSDLTRKRVPGCDLTPRPSAAWGRS